MLIYKIIAMLAVFFCINIFTVYAQYPTLPDTGPTPLPTLPMCEPDGCGDVCTDTYCQPGSYCTARCNDSTGQCAYTCSDQQDTCGGWPPWPDVCAGCWDTRYCTTNSSLAQTRCCNELPACAAECGVGGGPTPPGGWPTPTEPIVPSPTPTTPPVGTIEARAVWVTAVDTSCAAIQAVPTTDGEINGTTLQFTPSSASQPPAQAQVGANYVMFSNIVSGSYTLDPVPPTADWMFARACSTNLDTGTTSEGLSRMLPANTTIRWDVGYTLGTSWVQTGGGDVYASGTIRSFLPAVTPRVFSLDGTTGYPGIVTYGTGYDFDSDPFASGDTLISSANWEVNTSRSRINYYDFFYRRYGSPTEPTADPAFSNLLAVTQPPSSTTPHYVVGDMTTTGDWSVGNNETVVIFVNGNLILGGRVNITGNGFITFIVNGTITVADTVGTTSASTTPVVEGVYVAMKSDLTGSFNTGTSIAAATARFVGRGIFISDGFVLGRDLDGFGVGNTGASAELFTYNPGLLFTMPDTMKELSVTWQEVAP